MLKNSIEKTFIKAKSLEKKRDIDGAKSIYKSILEKYPNNTRAKENINRLNAIKSETFGINTSDQVSMKQLMDLYSKGEFRYLIKVTDRLLDANNNSFTLHNLRAMVFANLGKISDAKSNFQRSIEINPTHPDAYNNLGVLLQREGDYQGALLNYKKVTDFDDSYFQTHDNIGILLQVQGDYESAIKSHQRAIEIKPDYLEAYNNLGIAYQKVGKREKALSCYKKALAINSSDPRIYNNIGLIFQAESDIEKAKVNFETAIKLNPNFFEALNNLGYLFNEINNHESARLYLEKAISINPIYAEAYNNLGNSLTNLTRFDAAIDAFKKAIELRQDYTKAMNNLGNVFKDKGKLTEAINQYKNALRIDPKFVEVFSNLGVALKDQGNYDAAIENFEKAISLDPKFAKAMNNIGNAYMDIGKIDEALTNYKKAIEIDPNFAEAYHNLSKVVKFSSCSSYIDKMCEVYKSGKLVDRDKYHICFALGKAYGDIGEYEEAFSYLREGNALRKSLLNYDISDDQVLFNQIKDNFKKIKKFPPISSNKKITVTPIFILGMPRSGTTLVEQIISCHSQVYGGGELELCNQQLWPLIKNEQDMSKEILENFRAQYLDAIQGISNGKSFVTDKMPSNFRYIGLIKRALPEAIVIHVKRDPAAVCWSNYKISFSVRGLGYAYDLDDLVKYYQMYDDLMAFWGTHYDESLYQLDYERLTNDQVLETKKLINHIGLSWEETCLNPEYNRRSVSTASNQQIRQKIYKGSSNDWKKFEQFLNGKFDKLKN